MQVVIQCCYVVCFSLCCLCFSANGGEEPEIVDNSTGVPRIVLRGKVNMPDGVECGQLRGWLSRFSIDGPQPVEFSIDNDGNFIVKTEGLCYENIRIVSIDERWQAYRFLHHRELIHTAASRIEMQLEKAVPYRFRLSHMGTFVQDARIIAMNADGALSNVAITKSNGEATIWASSSEALIAAWGADNDGRLWTLESGKTFRADSTSNSMPMELSLVDAEAREIVVTTTDGKPVSGLEMYSGMGWHKAFSTLTGKSGSDGRVTNLRVHSEKQRIGIADPAWKLKSKKQQDDLIQIVVEPIQRIAVEGYLDPLPKSRGGWLIAMHCVHPGGQNEIVYSRVDDEGNFTALLKSECVYFCMLDDSEEHSNYQFISPLSSETESPPTIALGRVEPNKVDVLVTKGNERVPWAGYPVDVEKTISFYWVIGDVEESTDYCWRGRAFTDSSGKASIGFPFEVCDVSVFDRVSRKSLSVEYRAGTPGPVEFQLDVEVD